MKRTVLFLLTAATLAATAQAQTRIGSVTLNKPGTPVQQAPAQPSSSQQARMTQSSAVTQSRATSSTGNNSMSKVSVPSGWYEVTGRIGAAGGNVHLPAGSQVSVTLSDLTTPMQLVHIQFSTTYLSTPYQMVFNASRLNSTHTYAVQATVQDASGKVLYTSDRNSATLPVLNARAGKSAVVNVTVR